LINFGVWVGTELASMVPRAVHSNIPPMYPP